MKYSPGDTIIHKYDIPRIQYMGVGIYIAEIDLRHILKFTKLNFESDYSKKSMYNLQLYTDVFRELYVDEEGYLPFPYIRELNKE